MEMTRTNDGAVLKVSNLELNVIEASCSSYSETSCAEDATVENDEVIEAENIAACIADQISKTETRSVSLTSPSDNDFDEPIDCIDDGCECNDNVCSNEEVKICVQLGAKLSKEGNQWCALIGVNLQDGIAGFGDTVVAAFADLYKNLCTQKA